MAYSAAASGMRSSRFSSLLACSSASGGMPALAINSRKAAISADLSSSSPSSFWIWRSCSRRMCWRCCDDSDCWVCSPISLDRRSTWRRWPMRAMVLSSRAWTSNVSKKVLLLCRLGIDDAGDEVGQRRGRVEAVDGRGHFARHVRQQFDRLAGPLPQQTDARLDVRRDDLVHADLLDPCHEERIAGGELEDAEAPDAAADHVMRAVRRGHVAQDLGRGADLVQLLGGRLVDGRIGLQHEADHGLAAHGFLRRRDGGRAADGQRHHDAGKQHHVAQRQDDQVIRRDRADTIRPWRWCLDWSRRPCSVPTAVRDVS